jgi:hypothetical protein
MNIEPLLSASYKMGKLRVLVTHPEVHLKAIELLNERYVYYLRLCRIVK